MFDRPDWMSPTDFLILLSFEESTIFRILGPTTVADNLGLTRPHVSKRIAVMVEHGLLERVEEGKYRISSDGRAFLDGELGEEALMAGDE